MVWSAISGISFSNSRRTKSGMRPRQNDLDAMSDFLDLENHGFDAFVDVMGFTRNLFAARQNGFRFAEAYR